MRLPEDETLLNVYRKRRGLTLQQLSDVLGVKKNTAQRYCLPADNDGHRRPNAAAAAKMRAWSGGEVTIANYADPWLTTPAAAQFAEAAP